MARCLPNRTTYIVLMDGLCKRGMAVDALKMFDEMLERRIVPNVKVYTMIVLSLCNAGRIEDAGRLLCSMKENVWPPDEVTYFQCRYISPNRKGMLRSPNVIRTGGMKRSTVIHLELTRDNWRADQAPATLAPTLPR
ncbi:hypothetical protein BRADI_2g48725v3 [Brachypodium distachyon]|uniref:Pentacotripeptide-repeat region of PRORP domain-containing protein n=1 Tax=Brachypodium distachyon TaxID=15368 RepID=A0A0Q3R8Q8_BRADI|nr:hypothetical protein BRADI_2g48725v3 [Brachypodium distachyon]